MFDIQNNTLTQNLSPFFHQFLVIIHWQFFSSERLTHFRIFGGTKVRQSILTVTERSLG